MKKIFLLFLSFAVLTACSNDDDNAAGTDPIIGTWVLVDASAPLDTQFCFEEESTMTFNANNTTQATFYLEESDCIASSAPGTWTNNGNSLYTITVPVIGNLQGTVNFTNNGFTFSTTVMSFPGTLTFEKQ